MSGVLVDSSAWVAFFRGESAAVARVDPLLADDGLATNGTIYAEILSGTRNRPTYERTKVLFRSLRWLAEPDDVWDRIAEARFSLVRQGVQAAITDLLIGVTAFDSGHTILTRDRGFVNIQKVIPFELHVF